MFPLPGGQQGTSGPAVRVNEQAGLQQFVRPVIQAGGHNRQTPVITPTGSSSSGSATTSSSAMAAAVQNVVEVDEEDPHLQNWATASNAVIARSIAMDTELLSGGPLPSLQKAYAAGEKRARVDDANDFTETQTQTALETDVGKGKEPRRHIQGLATEPVDLQNLLNETTIQITLPQL